MTAYFYLNSLHAVAEQGVGKWGHTSLGPGLGGSTTHFPVK